MKPKKRAKRAGTRTVARDPSITLLTLLADIRAAVGDPDGKLMQDELVEHCRKLAHSADFNGSRVKILSQLQRHMRDPERTLVCDILANGQLLPDPSGKRYGFITTGKEHCAGSTQPARPAASSVALVRRPYRCTKCQETTLLADKDIWGKIIRCVYCTDILMDNRNTLPPNA